MIHKNLAFVTIHSTYSIVSVGLFVGKQLVQSITADHKQACMSLLGNLDQLLTNQQITLNNLDFIAVNQGPGPYTTLRITLTLADGLAFATGIPLVGVDGFMAFIDEIKDPRYTYTVILQNAFCREVFYAIHNNSANQTETGYLSIDSCVEKLETLGNETILIAGNGVELFAQELARITVPEIHKTDQLLESPSLESIGRTAYKNWESGTGLSSNLLPLYLKKPAYRLIAKAPSQP